MGAGIANELRCFARAVQERPESLHAPISAWYGTEDKLSAPDQLRDYLRGCSVVWREFEGAGSLVLLEHWEEVLCEAAGPERSEEKGLPPADR